MQQVFYHFILEHLQSRFPSGRVHDTMRWWPPRYETPTTWIHTLFVVFLSSMSLASPGKSSHGEGRFTSMGSFVKDFVRDWARHDLVFLCMSWIFSRRSTAIYGCQSWVRPWFLQTAGIESCLCLCTCDGLGLSYVPSKCESVLIACGL